MRVLWRALIHVEFAKPVFNRVSPRQLHDTLNDTLVAFERRPAIVSTDGQLYTFGDFAAVVRQLCDVFSRLHIEPGDRIGVYLPKHVLAGAALYAASASGAIFVPVNPALRSSQVAHIARDSGMTALITTPERADVLREAIAEVATLRALILSRRPGEDLALVQQVLAWDDVAATSADCPEIECRYSQASGDDLAALLYTSGSTGRPKGVMVSHNNLVSGCHSVAKYLELTPDDVTLAALPFSFDYGLNQLLTAVFVGATCVLSDFYFPKDLLTAIRRYRVTGLAGVPTLWNQIATAGSKGETFPELRYFTNSGGSLPAGILARLRTMFPKASPFMMYGLTEAFRSTYLPPAVIDERPGSIGKAVPGAKVIVIKDDGSRADNGEEGELVHVGELVSQGYWNAPEATKERFRPVPGMYTGDGSDVLGVWSGDIVRLDGDGYLYFVGRRDGMIKTSGYRVSPDELEEVVYTNPEIQEACVFGVPDDVLGQRIILVVVGAEQTDLDIALIENHYRQVVPTYMVPAEILVVQHVPKNMNGKYDRARLAADYRNGTITSPRVRDLG